MCTLMKYSKQVGNIGLAYMIVFNVEFYRCTHEQRSLNSPNPWNPLWNGFAGKASVILYCWFQPQWFESWATAWSKTQSGPAEAMQVRYHFSIPWLWSDRSLWTIPGPMQSGPFLKKYHQKYPPRKEGVWDQVQPQVGDEHPNAVVQWRQLATRFF